MGRLDTKPNIDDPDGFYAELIEAHEGLDEEQSMALNARLILILANQIGDRDLIREAIAAAGRPDGAARGRRA